MGFFTSKKGSIISDYFLLLENVGQFKSENMINVSLYDKFLELSAPMSKQPITLNYSQITDVYYGFETEIVQQNKSVIGRAAAGGIVFGPVGAIVGAVSGAGAKEKKEIHRLFVISYTPSSGGEAFLRFYDTRCYKGKKLAKQLKELCGIEKIVITSL